MSLLFITFSCIVFLGNLIEAIAGFGSTLLALALGSHLYPIEMLIPVLIPLNLALSTVILSMHHRAMDKKILFTRILPFTGLGLPIGIFVFQFGESHFLKMGFGFVISILAVFELLNLKSQKLKKPLGKASEAFFLIMGGFMQGLYASGGPFVVYYASRMLKQKTNFRSTLSFLWLVLNIVVFFTLIKTEKVTLESLKMSALLMPVVFLGIFTGEKIHLWASENHFKVGVYVLLLLAGTSLIF